MTSEAPARRLSKCRSLGGTVEVTGEQCRFEGIAAAAYGRLLAPCASGFSEQDLILTTRLTATNYQCSATGCGEDCAKLDEGKCRPPQIEWLLQVDCHEGNDEHSHQGETNRTHHEACEEQQRHQNL